MVNKGTLNDKHYKNSNLKQHYINKLKNIAIHIMCNVNHIYADTLLYWIENFIKKIYQFFRTLKMFGQFPYLLTKRYITH